MKKILFLTLLAAGITATAQVKVGTNPTVLATDANFQVEGTLSTNQFVVLKNGNVGIGTTIPTNRLHVNNFSFDPAGNDTASIKVEGGYGGGIVFAEALSRSSIWSNSGKMLTFGTGGTVAGIPEKMRLTEAGNLGIGTIPNERLDVAGNIRFSGALKPNNLPGSAGQILFSTGASSPPVWVTPTVTNTANIYSDNGTLTGNRTVDQGANTLNFTGTGVTTFNAGNVGIGTIAPTSKLDVATVARTGTHSTTAEGFNITANLPSIANNNVSNPTAARIMHSNGTVGLAFGFDGIAVDGTNNNNNFNFKSQSGIFKLHTASTANNNSLQRSSGSALANNDFVREQRFAGNFATYLDEDFTQILNVTSGSFDIIRQFNINDANNINKNVMRMQNSQVTADGLAGVPLAGYSGELSLNSVLQNRRIVLWDGARNSDHAFYGFGMSGSTLRYQVDAPVARHAFFAGIDKVSSKEIMTMLGTGNVGIGTTTPTAQLQIRALTSTSAKLDITAGNENVDAELLLSTPHPFNLNLKKTAIVARGISSASKADLHFVLNSVVDVNNYVTGTDTKLIIKNNGNVGIGTIAPTSKLEIDSGVANTSGLRFKNCVAGSNVQNGLGVNSSGDVIKLIDLQKFTVAPPASGALVDVAPSSNNEYSKIYVATGNSCGITAFAEFNFMSSLVAPNVIGVNAYAGTNSVNSTFIKNSSTSVSVTFPNIDNCADGTNDTSFNFTLIWTGSKFQIRNDSGIVRTYTVRVVPIFQ